MEKRVARIENLFPRAVRNYSTEELRQLRVMQDWILEVGFIFKLSKNTITLALNLINNFYALTPVLKEELQITGLACISLATQVNEIYAPEAEDYVFISDNSFSLEVFHRRLVLIVNTLGAKLRPCTGLDVLAGRMYELSPSARKAQADAIMNARNVALLLYTWHPKYFRLSATSMADLCVSAVKYLAIGVPSTKTDLEAINNLLMFESKFPSIIKRKMAMTLALFKNVMTAKIAPEPTPPTSGRQVRVMKPWEEDCEEIEELGSGTFGGVYKVKCGDRVLAVKRQELKDSALQELAILSTYQHLNVISAIERKVSPNGIEIFMEVGKSLYSLIHFSFGRDQDWKSIYVDGQLNDRFLLPEEERHGYILDICAGVDYLHSCGVMHRDLKPQNVIVIEGRAKIADFGLSTQCVISRHDDSPKQWEVLTLWYRAPEMLDSDFKDEATRYSFEIDIWSLACVLLELETGVAAFPGDDEESTLEMIGQVLGASHAKYYPKLMFEEKEERLACIKDNVVRETLLEMLDWKPKKRLSANDVFDRFAGHF